MVISFSQMPLSPFPHQPVRFATRSLSGTSSVRFDNHKIKFRPITKRLRINESINWHFTAPFSFVARKVTQICTHQQSARATCRRACLWNHIFSLSLSLFFLVCVCLCVHLLLVWGAGRESERREWWPSHRPAARDRFLDGITADESSGGLAGGLLKKIPHLYRLLFMIPIHIPLIRLLFAHPTPIFSLGLMSACTFLCIARKGKRKKKASQKKSCVCCIITTNTEKFRVFWTLEPG